MTNLELNTAFTRLAALEREQKELKNAVDDLRDLIKAEFNARNIEKIELDNYTATAQIIVSNRIDSKRLNKERPDLYQEYTTQTISQPLKYREVIQ